jgi:hypothetical protein
MKASLEVICMVLIIFVPFVGLALAGQPMAFFIYGASITAGSFLTCLVQTVRQDLKARRDSRKGKGKRNAY